MYDLVLCRHISYSGKVSNNSSRRAGVEAASCKGIIYLVSIKSDPSTIDIIDIATIYQILGLISKMSIFKGYFQGYHLRARDCTGVDLGERLGWGE